ncbi:hypothetical protein BN2127_JRS1_00348 [Bacillus cereus]|nr:hypothetical protein BN2127_JRS1_00348 [Bacillus cereus]
MSNESQIAKELTLAIIDRLAVPGKPSRGAENDPFEYNQTMATEVSKLYTEIYNSVLRAHGIIE